jgi:hypothetical protein
VVIEPLLLLGLLGAFSFLDLSSGNDATDDREQEGPDPSQGALNGTNAIDRFIGNSGADRMFSYGGSDLLEGGGGNDTLFGDGARIDSFGINNEPVQNIVILETDTLLGGAGEDDLIAYDGGVMTGGPGSDVFLTRLNVADPALQAQIPPALITDFNPAEDVLVLGPVAGVFPTPADIQVRLLTDGSGAEVLVRGITVARVIGGQSLTVGDIQIENISEVTDYRAA